MFFFNCNQISAKGKEKSVLKTNENASKTNKGQNDKKESSIIIKKADGFLTDEEKSKSRYKTARKPRNSQNEEVSLKQQIEEISKRFINKFPKSKKIEQPKPYSGKETSKKQTDADPAKITPKESTQIPEGKISTANFSKKSSKKHSTNADPAKITPKESTQIPEGKKSTANFSKKSSKKHSTNTDPTKITSKESTQIPEGKKSSKKHSKNTDPTKITSKESTQIPEGKKSSKKMNLKNE